MGLEPSEQANQEKESDGYREIPLDKIVGSGKELSSKFSNEQAFCSSCNEFLALSEFDDSQIMKYNRSVRKRANIQCHECITFSFLWINNSF